MKKIISILTLLFLITIITGCDHQTTSEKDTNQVNKKAKANSPIDSYSSNIQTAEKLEIYYFHRTARCNTCNTIGQYVKETIEQKYDDQIKNEKIYYQELNIDLAENKEIADKYQASGSSLYINRIIDGQDNIEQDTNVWRLSNNEAQLKNYLEEKINSYLDL